MAPLLALLSELPAPSGMSGWRQDSWRGPGRMLAALVPQGEAGNGRSHPQWSMGITPAPEQGPSQSRDSYSVLRKPSSCQKKGALQSAGKLGQQRAGPECILAGRPRAWRAPQLEAWVLRHRRRPGATSQHSQNGSPVHATEPRSMNHPAPFQQSPSQGPVTSGRDEGWQGSSPHTG